jgi:hypothetical protein
VPHHHTYFWVPSQFPSLWSLWGPKSGRLLTAPSGTCFSCMFANSEARHNDAPYRSISMNYILLDSLFHKEYRYDLIISPFSTDKKQQARLQTYRSPDMTNSNKHSGTVLVCPGLNLSQTGVSLNVSWIDHD